MSALNWSDTTHVVIFSACAIVTVSIASVISYRCRRAILERWNRRSVVIFTTNSNDGRNTAAAFEKEKQALGQSNNSINSRIASTTKHSRTGSALDSQSSRSSSSSSSSSSNSSSQTNNGNLSVSSSSRHARSNSGDADARRYIACSHCHATLALPISNSSPVVQCIYCKCINNIELEKSTESIQTNQQTDRSQTQLPRTGRSTRPKFQYDEDEKSIQRPVEASRHHLPEPSVSTSATVNRVQFADHDEYEPSVLSRPRPRKSSVTLPPSLRSSKLAASRPLPSSQTAMEEAPTVGDLVADKLDEEYAENESEDSMVINQDDEREEYYYDQQQEQVQHQQQLQHDVELDIDGLQHQTTLEYDMDDNQIQREPSFEYDLQAQERSRSQAESDDALEGEIGAMISDLRLVQDQEDPIGVANMQEQL